MRFTATATAAIMAGSAMATTGGLVTVSTTEMVTISDCPETVTDCPYRTSQVTTPGAAMTTSTVVKHVVHTITSCAPTVTNCPAHSTVLSTETIPLYTTVCPVASSAPGGPYPNGTMPGGNQPGGSQPGGSQPGAPISSAAPAPACPTFSVTAITKSYTTVMTSVEYSTVEVPCPTAPAAGNGGAPAPSQGNPAGNGGNGGAAQPTGSNPGGANNGTSGNPPVTAGAGSLAGSAAFAAVAGLVAFLL